MCQKETLSRIAGARGERALRLALRGFDGLDLALARARASTLLRQLPLAASLRDLGLQVLRRQRATAGVVDTLMALADCLASGIATRSVASPPPPTRLPVWPSLDERSHVAIIPATDVVYAFAVGAMTKGFLHVGWRLDARREQMVYLRVNRFKDLDPRGVGVLATPFRSLKNLRALLDPTRFVPANQSMVVNCAYVRHVEARSTVALWVALTDGRMESLHVSRACWPALRRALGLAPWMCRQPSVAGVDP
jgi:hypothetical protein